MTEADLFITKKWLPCMPYEFEMPLEKRNYSRDISTIKNGVRSKNIILDKDNFTFYTVGGELPELPLFVEFEITRNCNLNCVHCYMDSTKQSKNLLTKDVFKIVDNIRNLGVMAIQITGGELFTRSDIFEIIEYIHKKGIYMELTTNVTLLTDSDINRLTTFLPMRLAVSLDSADPAEFDKFRGAASTFEKVIANAKKLVDKKFDICLFCTVTNKSAHTYEQMRALIELCIKNGFKSLRFIDLIGKGRADSAGLALNAQQLSEVRDAFVSLRKQYAEKLSIGVSEDLLGGSYGYTLDEPTVCGCDSFTKNLLINCEGKVVDCLCVGLRNVEGNAVTESLKDIWERNRFPMKNEAECGGCKYNKICGGPCKARMN